MHPGSQENKRARRVTHTADAEVALRLIYVSLRSVYRFGPVNCSSIPYDHHRNTKSNPTAAIRSR